jgi:hypothetical protein
MSNSKGDKSKKDDGAPSADEIIEALSLEMGASEKAEGAQDESAAPSVEREMSDEKKKPSGDDPMAGLGGIFDVPVSNNKATEEPKAAPKAAARKEAPKAAPKAAAKQEAQVSDSGVEAIDTLFNVSGSSNPDLGDTPPAYDALDDDPDLAKFESKAGGGTTKLLIGVIVLLVLGMGAMAIFGLGLQDDLVAVLDGTYRDKKDAEKRRIEEEHLKQQQEALEKYGTLNIIGEPDKALVKFQFDGDREPHTVFAPTSKEGQYSELRLPQVIHNIKIKKPFAVRVEAPGYRPQTITVTKDRWIAATAGDYQYQLAVYLEPESVESRTEMADRMLPFTEDGEEDGITGVIKVNSNPPGAQIELDGRLVVDKDGKPVLTPATLDHLMPKPPKEGEKKKKKDEVKPIQVNVPHHKVSVFWPEEQKKPSYTTGVYRNLWTCVPKDEKEIKRLPKDARPAFKCNYEYTVDADFTGIDSEIRRQEAIKAELEKEKAKLEEMKRQQDALKEGK